MSLIWPNGSVTRPRVTSSFGMRRHPVSGGMRLHRGIDLAGWRDIVSPVAGRVTTKAYQKNGAGYYVNITADNADVFKFFHLALPSPLTKGQRVEPGTYIGQMGMSGSATGVHLHFETWTGGKAIDPDVYYARHQKTATGLSATATTHQEDDPMLYMCGDYYCVYAHNGGFVEVKHKSEEYNNLVRRVGEPVWVEPRTLAALIEDGRGNQNSALLAAVRAIAAKEG